ncbi:P-loop containing nucleoside triphosphate hydrolase protein [Roridomyces roridus]|uniref:P-loop containing nucleoside triphosphate hydrolase protein n=1 Tax=Roridomyces roridus TaxID=1738132 RepID=A0AAD7F9N2_9AGAR|nr:P-loop containing nucleoside triphosphate hydrolase protein [Roridomyces roridus]
MADGTSLRARHPDLYLKDANIDRHACRRVVPMEVLSLGMGRTGTVSMQAALRILGYNDCYHGFDIFLNVKDCDMWMEAFAAKYQGKGKFGRAEFDRLLGHCMAVTDAPCNSFGPELIDAYPEAKVILVEREIESWYKSFSIVAEGIYGPGVQRATILDPFWTGRSLGVLRQWLALEFGANSLEKAKEVARERYRAHYAEIRRVTPKERLLEYELGSGWEPLCKFLGKPVPDVPFPRLNEAETLKEKIGILRWQARKRVLTNTGAVLVVAFGLYHWLRRV